jgi:hypothetical protein
MHVCKFLGKHPDFALLGKKALIDSDSKGDII